MKPYLTVKDFSRKHSCFSEASLRWQIFNAKKNGLEKAIKRLGSKVLLDESAFFEWIENKNK